MIEDQRKRQKNRRTVFSFDLGSELDAGSRSGQDIGGAGDDKPRIASYGRGCIFRRGPLMATVTR